MTCSTVRHEILIYTHSSIPSTLYHTNPLKTTPDRSVSQTGRTNQLRPNLSGQCCCRVVVFREVVEGVPVNWGGRRGTSATYSQLQTDTVTMSPPNVPPLCNPISTYILGIFLVSNCSCRLRLMVLLPCTAALHLYSVSFLNVHKL